MFAAFAAGAPLGTILYNQEGFGAVALATAGAPLLTLILLAPLRGAPPAHKRRPSILSVVSRIFVPGFGAALSSVGFGVIAAFSSLLFADQGWTPVCLAFSAYAVALIVARLTFGHLPDRLGGARCAVVRADRGDGPSCDGARCCGLGGGCRRCPDNPPGSRRLRPDGVGSAGRSRCVRRSLVLRYDSYRRWRAFESIRAGVCRSPCT
jgi:hypothetical protein